MKWNKLAEKVDRILLDESLYCEHPDILCKYLVAGEDHRFWDHAGVDIISLCRASLKTIFLGKREGGSTIAMQLVRTITNNYDYSIYRKVIEIYLALKISENYSKIQILNLYLSVAYFGWNMHGATKTCKALGFKLDELSEVQAASVVSRLKYPQPRFFSTIKNEKIYIRTHHIINRKDRYERLNYEALRSS